MIRLVCSMRSASSVLRSRQTRRRSSSSAVGGRTIEQTRHDIGLPQAYLEIFAADGTPCLRWNGTAWVCASDVDTTYTASTGLSLTGTESGAL